MTYINMTERKPKQLKPVRKQSRPADAAFDVWLERGLHQLYDDVTREPIPEELLRLIEGDRSK